MIRSRLIRPLVLALLPTMAVIALTVSSEDVTPRWANGQLLVSAPKTHFLVGKTLERLRNTAAAVPIDFQFTVATAKGNPALERALARFVVSYDIWEEKFTVMRIGNQRHSGANLTAAAAEAWCLENISIPTTNISPDQRLWLRLEIRSEDSRGGRALAGESGMSLAALINLFSQPPRSLQDHWVLETGPVKLNDLRRP